MTAADRKYPREADWCPRSGERPVGARDSSLGPTGLCRGCGRRVRLLTDGRLRRHRKETSVVMADDGGLARRT